MNSATFSQDGRYRTLLTREVVRNHTGTCMRIGFIGVNPSQAGIDNDDHTTTKLKEFARRANACGYLLGNAYSRIATDVRQLKNDHEDGIDINGPDNDQAIAHIITSADILVPMWGSRHKLAKPLRSRLDDVADLLFDSGKPVYVFGLTKHGDPMHPLMLSYATRLTMVARYARHVLRDVLRTTPDDPMQLRAIRSDAQPAPGPAKDATDRRRATRPQGVFVGPFTAQMRLG
jgi:hypothetical protein